MILGDKRDKEAWVREKTIESLKANTFLKENDIVLVAETNNFYKVISTETDIPLQKNLYAQVQSSEIIGNSSTANKLKTPRNINLTGDVTGNVSFDGSKDVNIITTVHDDSHNHSNETITSLDASKITSGTIDVARLPAAALERLVEVDDDTARFNLTKEQIQLGDVVKVKNTLKMYKVINDNKLNTEDGYTVFVAGRAAEVPWSGVTGKPNKFPPEEHNQDWNTITGKPSSFTPSNHTHTKSQITDFPSSLKNPYGLTISLNGSSQGAYDGSSAKSINITPTNIGAYNKSEVNSLLNDKAQTSHSHKSQDIIDNHRIFIKALNDGDDLNNITTPGFYRKDNDKKVIANSPISDQSYVLIVTCIKPGNDYYVTQIAQQYNSERLFIRHKVDNWSKWERLATLSELTWNNVKEKPSSFPPTSHSHSWGSITEKPSSFSPSSHTHNIIKDAGDNRDLRINYSANAPSDWGYVGVWKNGVLYASDKNRFLRSDYVLLNNGVAIQGSMASTDKWIIQGGGSNDQGFLEIATKDNGNEPIYFKQYGLNDIVAHSITLMDANGNQQFNTVIASGNVTCSDCITTSDKRLKKDIVKIKNALDKVNQLNGYTFLKEGDNQRTTGLLAQEVLKVLPEAVFERKDNFYGVSYGNIVGLLIEAIKELQNEIITLKVKNNIY